ncbi:UNVERIFIED_CONTAM: hypothetical protein HDU68_004416 [Siphonaria sp. JEL0065]|nr:hypothetical protein HDU68_004416 [Siphonaria sp. JEL0065]
MKTNFPSILLFTFAAVHAHIFAECPKARTCITGGYWGLSENGVWQRSPCDRFSTPSSPVSALAIGQDLCLEVHEFVPHDHSSFKVSLSYDGIVNPGDSNPEWTVLYKQDKKEIGSGVHGISVQLPANRTCESCTLQFVQQSSEFGGVTYYSCANVRIVSALESGSVSTSCGIPSGGQCVAWTPKAESTTIEFQQKCIVSALFVLFMLLASTVVALSLKQSRENNRGALGLDYTLKGRLSRIRVEISKGMARRAFVLSIVGAFVGILVVSTYLIGCKTCAWNLNI